MHSGWKDVEGVDHVRVLGVAPQKPESEAIGQLPAHGRGGALLRIRVGERDRVAWWDGMTDAARQRGDRLRRVRPPGQLGYDERHQNDECGEPGPGAVLREGASTYLPSGGAIFTDDARRRAAQVVEAESEKGGDAGRRHEGEP